MPLSQNKIDARSEMLPKESFKYAGLYAGIKNTEHTRGVHALTEVNKDGARTSACGITARFVPFHIEEQWAKLHLKDKTCLDCKGIVG